MVGWFLAIPFFAVFDVPIVNGTWVPPLWFGVLAVPLGILAFFVSLHVLNGVELGVRALGRGHVPRSGGGAGWGVARASGDRCPAGPTPPQPLAG